jgi:hypothetical protein
MVGQEQLHLLMEHQLKEEEVEVVQHIQEIPVVRVEQAVEVMVEKHQELQVHQVNQEQQIQVEVEGLLMQLQALQQQVEQEVQE